MNFEDKTTTKKGDYAESLVVRELMKNKLTVYVTASKRSHPFDLIITGDYEAALGGNFNAADVKAKSRRYKYYDTGIDVRAYNYYKALKSKFNFDAFYLFFVDEEEEGRCYFGEIDELSEEYIGASIKVDKDKILPYKLDPPMIIYPKIEKARDKNKKDIIYFHLDSMKHFFDLTEEEIFKLKSLTTKQECYKK